MVGDGCQKEFLAVVVKIKIRKENGHYHYEANRLCLRRFMFCNQKQMRCRSVLRELNKFPPHFYCLSPTSCRQLKLEDRPKLLEAEAFN